MVGSGSTVHSPGDGRGVSTVLGLGGGTDGLTVHDLGRGSGRGGRSTVYG